MRIIRYTVFSLSLLVVAYASDAVGDKQHEVFHGYGAYHAKMRQLCQEIAVDGRREAYQKILKSNSDRDVLCLACRPLLQALDQGCSGAMKSTRKNKKGKEEATPKPILPQREPSASVLELVSSIFRDIRSDSRIANESQTAVSKLVLLLRDSKGRAQGEGEYFSILAEYVAAPFEGFVVKEPLSEDGTPVDKPTPKVNVDDLFE